MTIHRINIPARRMGKTYALKLAAVLELLRAHEAEPRFKGRRSLDKETGEVYEITDPDCVPAEGYPLVEVVPFKNFEGERVAVEKAKSLSRVWTAEQILKVLDIAEVDKK